MLTLPRQPSSALCLTPAQFADLCAANPEALLELDADGHLITMTPAGGETGARNSTLTSLRWLSARQSPQAFKVVDSSTGFLLPDGSVRSPDAAVVRWERWRALTEEQRRGFLPLCPDLVVELASVKDAGPSDPLPEERAVEVWTAEGEPRCLENPVALSAAPLLPGLGLELAELWPA